MQVKVSNYWEAIGVVAAHKAGIDPYSLRRNRINNINCISSTSPNGHAVSSAPPTIQLRYKISDIVFVYIFYFVHPTKHHSLVQDVQLVNIKCYKGNSIFRNIITHGTCYVMSNVLSLTHPVKFFNMLYSAKFEHCLFKLGF